jgi:hypothetical protein
MAASVEEMTEVMATSTDQTVRLKQAEVQLRLSIQPWNGWGAHRPCIHIQTHEKNDICRTAKSIIRSDNVHSVGSGGLVSDVGGCSYVFEQVDETGSVVGKG